MKNLVIGILAHVDAGKTTLSESIMYLSGGIRKLGRVDHGNAFLDTNELERCRGITIFSKQAVFQTGDKKFTLLDTPGHVDFSAEMERTLQVLDYAILVINGADGVQGHTRTLWNLLKRYEIPAFIFVNKIRIQQVILNILKNSIEAIGDDGKIKLYTKVTDNNIKIYIGDNGVGMDKDELDRINEAFFTTKKNGTGLGIYLSNEIIKLHSGSMKYSSIKNEGTKVILTLPINKKDIKFIS